MRQRGIWNRAAGVRARLLHWISPKSGEMTRQIFGSTIKLDLADYIQRSIYLDTFESRETALIKNYLQAGMTFVDVGANIGYYTLLAASLVKPEGLVIAFEPSPYAYARLAQTVKQNNLPQVKLNQVGLSDAIGTAQLFLPREVGNHSPSMIPHHAGTPVNVPVTTLDEYIEAQKIQHIDLVKIDVEGLEPNVVRGATRAISQRRIKAILCEFNKYWLEQNGSSPRYLYKLLTDFGFKAQDVCDFDADIANILFEL
jgi:FkbM family methyltransferase